MKLGSHYHLDSSKSGIYFYYIVIFETYKYLQKNKKNVVSFW
jgi:hypothetical protein